MELFEMYAFWVAMPLGILGLGLAWWNNHQTMHLVALVLAVPLFWYVPPVMGSFWHHLLFAVLFGYVWYLYGALNVWAWRKYARPT